MTTMQMLSDVKRWEQEQVAIGAARAKVEAEPVEPTEAEKAAFDAANEPERFQGDWECCPS